MSKIINQVMIRANDDSDRRLILRKVKLTRLIRFTIQVSDFRNYVLPTVPLRCSG